MIQAMKNLKNSKRGFSTYKRKSFQSKHFFFLKKTQNQKKAILKCFFTKKKFHKQRKNDWNRIAKIVSKNIQIRSIFLDSCGEEDKEEEEVEENKSRSHRIPAAGSCLERRLIEICCARKRWIQTRKEDIDRRFGLAWASWQQASVVSWKEGKTLRRNKLKTQRRRRCLGVLACLIWFFLEQQETRQ